MDRHTQLGFDCGEDETETKLTKKKKNHLDEARKIHKIEQALYIAKCR